MMIFVAKTLRIRILFFCEDHSPKKARTEMMESIIKNDALPTRYSYTLPEFSEFVQKEADKLPTEQLSMYEELSLLKAQIQIFLTRVEEAISEGEERKILLAQNRLNNHIQDTIKAANRIWQMNQTAQQIPAIHILAILNQIQNEARHYIDDQQFDMFSEKMKQIKIGLGDIEPNTERSKALYR